MKLTADEKKTLQVAADLFARIGLHSLEFDQMHAILERLSYSENPSVTIEEARQIASEKMASEIAHEFPFRHLKAEVKGLAIEMYAQGYKAALDALNK